MSDPFLWSCGSVCRCLSVFVFIRIELSELSSYCLQCLLSHLIFQTLWPWYFTVFFFSLNFLKYMYQTSGRGIWQCLVFSWAFPVISAGKEYACNAGNPGSIPGLGRFPWRKDRLPTQVFLSFPGSSDGKESTCDARDLGLIPGMERFPWRRAWQPTPLFLPGKSPWKEEPGGLQYMG